MPLQASQLAQLGFDILNILFLFELKYTALSCHLFCVNAMLLLLTRWLRNLAKARTVFTGFTMLTHPNNQLDNTAVLAGFSLCWPVINSVRRDRIG